MLFLNRRTPKTHMHDMILLVSPRKRAYYSARDTPKLSSYSAKGPEMRTPASELLARALKNHGVSPHLHHHIINDTFGPKAVASVSKLLDAERAQWSMLLSKLAYDRRSLVSNRKKWPVEMVPLYEDYLKCMDKVRTRILHASTERSLAAEGRRARRENMQRVEDNRQPGGTNGALWQSWVPAPMRQAFIDEVDLTYTRMTRTQGNRWVPFASASYRREAKQRAAHIEASIKGIRDMVADPTQGTSSTLYGALLLAGVRMAEIELYRRLKAYKSGMANPFDQPVPVHWSQLCSPDMQKRLRAAAAEPTSVDPTGLSTFFDALIKRPTDTTPAVAQALNELPEPDDNE